MAHPDTQQNVVQDVDLEGKTTGTLTFTRHGHVIQPRDPNLRQIRGRRPSRVTRLHQSDVGIITFCEHNQKWQS